MNALDKLAKMLFLLACVLVVLVMLTGCSGNREGQEKSDEMMTENYDSDKNALNDTDAKTEVSNVTESSGTTHDHKNAVKVVNHNQTVNNSLQDKKEQQPVRLMVKGEPIDIPAPEMENINLYAQALQEHLLRRYNNTPRFAGKVAKVQLIAEKEPEFSLDRKRIRMNWSQVVLDSWGERIPELEEEYYIVVFGDGKPLLQRTRPSITIGLNNESGYSEFSQVRGGELSKMKYSANPQMFEKADIRKTGLLDDKLESKDSQPQPYHEYDIKPIQPPSENNLKKLPVVPIIQPAGEELQAVAVLERR